VPEMSFSSTTPQASNTSFPDIAQEVGEIPSSQPIFYELHYGAGSISTVVGTNSRDFR